MNIETVRKIIEAAALADDTVIMEGLHGIGKSEVVKQFAKDHEYHMETLFLSHQEVGDLIGIPHTIERDGVTITTWSIPIWLQRMNDAAKSGKHCVLFLDELNRAPIDVRQSALQLVLERQIHEHMLPIVNNQRTLVVAAINPADAYQVDELDPALLDRFLHCKLEADAKAWLEWARGAKISPVIRDFIAENQSKIHWTPADGGIGATPRSWTKLSAFIEQKDKIDEDILFQVIKGKIGQEIGGQFYSFYKNYVDVIKMADIEKCIKDNKDKFPKVEDLAAQVAELMERTEAIQKSDMAHQMAEKYMGASGKKGKSDIFNFLIYLYSLEIEICVSFLKGYCKDEPEKYRSLAAADGTLNNKELFKRIVVAAEKK